ncbi:hypothetical protein [Salinimicrobium sp. WS361]|uniref:hypothetical protein n=1 Tax=Salinimicrobium sp. WS361 TaxID=3425123 RepID=UPI003D6E8A37
MKNSKIELDLKDYEGRSISELKNAIYNELNKLKVIYSAPRPGNDKRIYSYHPFETLPPRDDRDYHIIKEIQYGDPEN